MPHLIGLLEPGLDPETTAELLHRMAARTAVHAPALPPPQPLATEGAGTACLEHPSWVTQDDGVIAGICGRPRWSHTDIASVQDRRGPAAALLESYRRFGDNLLQHLHGPFAIALLQPKARQALLAVDRMGVRSLAWRQIPGGILFASRADVLSEHPAAQTHLDLQALYNYFYFEVIPSPDTIFAGTHKLLPGQFLRFSEGRVESGFYWQLGYSESSASYGNQKNTLERLLKQSVAVNLGESATGAFLSGGLDSSTVSGWFSRLSPQPADVYGIGFSDAPGYDEMEYARATARHFGVHLHEYYVTPADVISALPDIAAAYDEPFGNASALPAYYCARMAREDGKSCLLAGDGGDEIFAGNARYAKQKIFQVYHRLPASLRHLLLEPIAFGLPAVQRIPPVRKLRSYIEQARIPMPARLETYNFLHRTPLDEIFNPDFLASVDPGAPIANCRKTYERADTDQMLKRMLHLDLKNVIADNDLRKVNRTCELAGIEVRYPMLEEELVEFAASIPSERLLHRFQLRAFYREAMKDFLASETLAKRKHGFGLPFGIWMQHDPRLKELAYDSIQSMRKYDWLLPTYIDRILEAHRSEHADYYGVMIVRLVMLEQWLRVHGY